MVVVLETVLEFVLGIDLEYSLVFVQDPALDPEWGFDLDTLGQEFVPGLHLGRCQVCQDSLELGRVADLHHLYRVSGCRVSGIPLFHEWDTFQEWIHQTSSVRYRSSIALWLRAASSGWRSARSTS